MIDTRQISIVFQGELPQAPRERQALQASLSRLRQLLPASPVLLGTWEGSAAPDADQFDRVVYSRDPGSLPAFKFGATHAPNNLNRQLAGSAAVLREVSTPYVLKLRLDSEIHQLGFLTEYQRYGRNAAGRERVVVPGFFTLDPRMFERLPFHVSDWFAFGPTAVLQQWWAAPPMSPEAATYYDSHRHAAHTNWFERRFRTQFAIEQYITAHYARTLGYQTPAYLNDTRAGVLAAHDQFIAQELLVLDQTQFGISSRKYYKVARSSLQYFNCLGFLDWYLLALESQPGLLAEAPILAAARRRARAKRMLRAVSSRSEPLMPLVRQPLIKAFISRTLRVALRLA